MNSVFDLCMFYSAVASIFVMFDGTNWTSFTPKNSPLPVGNVPSIAIGKNEVKWIGTINGLCRFDGKDWKVYTTKNSPLPDNQINALCIDVLGSIWIATKNGVAVFDGHDSWKVFTSASCGIPAGEIRNIAIDNKGVKWFGTAGKGLARFAAHGVAGRVVDESDKPIAGFVVKCGDYKTETDADGRYYFELPLNFTGVLSPSISENIEPKELHINNLSGFLFGQNFVHSTKMVAKGKSTEKVMVTPNLAEGYIIINLESPTAEVEFVNAEGESIRTIPAYKNGSKITISKMPKGFYTLYIRTKKGEKSLKFNLK